MTRQIAFGCALCAVLLGGSQAAAITLLHEFTGTAVFPVTDGQSPRGRLAQSGSTLFGTTNEAGASFGGTVFSVETDGTGFTTLHDFAGGVNDGNRPQAGVILSGSTLFGTTMQGGDNNDGTVYSVETDGTGFTLLHEFDSGVDGMWPMAELTLIGSTLFGTTQSAGGGTRGTVFSVETDGTGFTTLHEFAGGVNDGATPRTDFAVSGSTLFGTTGFGGDDDNGTVFSVETDGTGFTLLHEFAGGNTDGDQPRAGLILSGSTLFGTTFDGGVGNDGTIFSIETDGTGFTLLYSFGFGGGTDVDAGLVQSGSTLFGTASQGGAGFFDGTIFSIETDGSDFTVVHDFAGGANDGSVPLSAELIVSGGTLFGTTADGGDNDNGTVFSLQIIPEPGTLILVILGGLVAAAAYGRRRLVRQPRH